MADTGASTLAVWRARMAGPGFGADLRVRLLQAAPLGAALLVAPGLLASAIDLPKRLFVEALAILGVAVWVADAVDRGRFQGPRDALLAPMISLVAGMLLATIGSANPGLALESTGLMAALFALTWLAGTVTGPQDRGRVVAALLLAGGIEGIYGILQYAGIDLLPWASSWGSRCFGTIGNPVFFAEFLAPLFVLATALWTAERDDERKDLLFILLAILYVALLFSQTRSAWLGSLAGIGVMGVVLARRVNGGRRLLRENRTGLIVLPLVAAALVLTVSSTSLFGKNAFPLRDRLRDAVNFNGWTVRHRLVLWRAGALIVRAHPVLGAGPDHFRSEFPLVQATFRGAYAAKGFMFAPKEQKAHNDYVQTAAETGLVGLGLLLWFVAGLVRVGWSSAASAATVEDGALVAGLLGGCVALLLDAGLNFPFRIIPACIVFWLFAGLLSGARRGAVVPERRMAPAPASPVRRHWLAAAALAVAVAWIGRQVLPALEADREMSAGNFYAQAGMWDMAGGAYEASVELRSDDPLAQYQLGFTLDKMSAYDWTGRTWDRSLRHYEEARRLGLNDEKLFSQMAMLYEKKGRYRRCTELGELALTIFPESADMLGNVAYWYAVRGADLARGLTLADRALALVPAHPLYLWDRALVLEQMGRYREAYAGMQAALPRLPLVLNGASYAPDLVKDIARLKELAGRK